MLFAAYHGVFFLHFRPLTSKARRVRLPTRVGHYVVVPRSKLELSHANVAADLLTIPPNVR